MIRLLSIVIPVYNAERFLKECVDTILCQMTSQVELLLIDDGSTDHSGTICDTIANQATGIRVFHQDNGGVSSARNLGIEKAEGKWIFFSDADDTLLPGAIRAICSAIEKTDAEQIIFDYCKRGDPHSEMVYKFSETLLEGQNALHKYQIGILSNTYRSKLPYQRALFPSPWAKCFRRDFLIRNGLRFPLQLKKSEDEIFLLDCSMHLTKLQLIPECVYLYRPTDSSATVHYHPDMVATMTKYLSELKKRCDLLDNEEIWAGYAERCCASVVNVLILNYYHKDNPLPRQERYAGMKEFAALPWAAYAAEHYQPWMKDYSLSEKFFKYLSENRLWELSFFVGLHKLKRKLKRSPILRTCFHRLKAIARS